jgi:hypothetical protein
MAPRSLDCSRGRLSVAGDETVREVAVRRRPAVLCAKSLRRSGEVALYLPTLSLLDAHRSSRGLKDEHFGREIGSMWFALMNAITVRPVRSSIAATQSERIASWYARRIA